MAALARVVIRRCGPSRFGLFSPIWKFGHTFAGDASGFHAHEGSGL